MKHTYSKEFCEPCDSAYRSYACMMNPTNPTIDKLREILTELAPRAEESYHITGAKPFYAIKEEDLPKLEQAIIAWALEAVGENEPVKVDGIYADRSQYQRIKRQARNQLRAEIRAKLGGNSV